MLRDLRCRTTSLSCLMATYQAAGASLCEVDFRLYGKEAFYSKFPEKYVPVDVSFSLDKGMKGFT